MTASAGQRRVRLRLHYDGAGFRGWQVQPGLRTVEAELGAALSRLTQRPTPVVGAGRTDARVHATGQVASALVPGSWRAPELRRALNAVLPHDIWVAAAEEVPVGFHARYDAVAREYAYRVGTADAVRSPFLRRWCWPVDAVIEPDLLDDAARRFAGTRSFDAFAKSGQPERGVMCTVRFARWRPWRAGFVFQIVANRFLHRMVRYMVGTMIDVARDRRPVTDVDALLARAEGVRTSRPAPPQGLFLTRVYYSEHELAAREGIDEVLPG